jgi:hypothetical protein
MRSIDKTIGALNAARHEHHLFSQFKNDVHSAISAANGSEVLWLTGPSRVGKTRGTEEVRLALEAPHNNSGRHVTMRVAARNTSTSGGFSTKAFTYQMLKAIDHPFYGSPAPDDPSGSELAKRIHRTSEAQLQMALQFALVDLEIKYIFVDEVQHLLHIQGGKAKVSAVLDSWKGLAEETNTTLLLSGAYPLLELLPANAHLVGRSEVIHFPRYQITRPEDLDHFGALVHAIDCNIGQKAFSPHLKLVFNESLGCAGLLLRLVRTVLAKAALQTGGKITKGLIRQCARKQAERQSLLDEILEGERMLDYAEPKPSPSATSEPQKTEGKPRPFQTQTRSHAKGGRS